MAARTFETQAVIKLIDQLSGPMSSLAKSMAGIQKTMAGDAARAQEEMARKSETTFSRMKKAAKEAFSGMSLIAGVEAGHMIREMATVGYEMDKVMTRWQALGRYSAEQRADMQKFADVGNPYVGKTPGEAGEAVASAMQAGIHDPEKQKTFAENARGYASAAKIGIGEAVTELADHIMMIADVKRPDGTRSTFEEMSPETMKEAELRAAGRMEIFARNSNQTSGQVYNLMRTAGPAATSMGVSFEDLEVMGAQLATAGIKDAEAGTAIKTLLSRSAVPTAAGRAAVTELGMKMSDYQHFNPDRVADVDLDKMFEMRVGKLSDATKKRINAIADKFRQDQNPDDYQRDMSDALHDGGSKSMKNRVAANNLARDSLVPFMGTMDIAKFVGDLMAKVGRDGAIGVLTELYGKNQAGRLVNIDPKAADEKSGIRDRIRADGDPVAYEAKIITDLQNSYSGAIDGATHAFKGSLDQLYLVLEPTIVKLAHAATTVAEAIGDMSSPFKLATDAALALAAGFAAVKTAMITRDIVKAVTGHSDGKSVPADADITVPKSVVAPEPAVATKTLAQIQAEADKAALATKPQFGPLTEAQAASQASTAEKAASLAIPSPDKPQFGPYTSEQLAQQAGLSVRDWERQQIAAERAAEEAKAAAAKAPAVPAKPPVPAGEAVPVKAPTVDAPAPGVLARLTRVLGPVFEFLEKSNNFSIGFGAAFDPELKAKIDAIHEKYRDAERGAVKPAEPDKSGHPRPVDPLMPSKPTAAEVGTFLVPPAGATPRATAAAPAAPPPIQEFHVQGDADVRQQIDIHLTGLEGFAGEVQRRIESKFQINLGTGMTGGQGLQPVPRPTP